MTVTIAGPPSRSPSPAVGQVAQLGNGFLGTAVGGAACSASGTGRSAGIWADTNPLPRGV